jgi:hypothetical protein
MYGAGVNAFLASLYRAIASQQSTTLAWFVIIVLAGMLVVWYTVRR